MTNLETADKMPAVSGFQSYYTMRLALFGNKFRKPIK